MNAKLSPSRIAKATASMTDEIRWAEACLEFASEAGQTAAKEAIDVFETCLAALEFVKEVRNENQS